MLGVMEHVLLPPLTASMALHWAVSMQLSLRLLESSDLGYVTIRLIVHFSCVWSIGNRHLTAL